MCVWNGKVGKGGREGGKKGCEIGMGQDGVRRGGRGR